MLEKKCSNNRSTRRYLRVLLVLVGLCVVVAGVGFFFRDTPFVRNVQRRFMMGR